MGNTESNHYGCRNIDAMQGPILQTLLPQKQLVFPCVSTNPTPDPIVGFLCRLIFLSFVPFGATIVLRFVLSNMYVYLKASLAAGLAGPGYDEWHHYVPA